MRIRMSDARERKVKHLMEALNENTKSKALFAAADYAIRMRGGTNAVPTGQIAELMQRAQEQGSAPLTADSYIPDPSNGMASSGSLLSPDSVFDCDSVVVLEQPASIVAPRTVMTPRRVCIYSLPVAESVSSGANGV